MTYETFDKERTTGSSQNQGYNKLMQCKSKGNGLQRFSQ